MSKVSVKKYEASDIIVKVNNQAKKLNDRSDSIHNFILRKYIDYTNDPGYSLALTEIFSVKDSTYTGKQKYNDPKFLEILAFKTTIITYDSINYEDFLRNSKGECSNVDGSIVKHYKNNDKISPALNNFYRSCNKYYSKQINDDDKPSDKFIKCLSNRNRLFNTIITNYIEAFSNYYHNGRVESGSITISRYCFNDVGVDLFTNLFLYEGIVKLYVEFFGKKETGKINTTDYIYHVRPCNTNDNRMCEETLKYISYVYIFEIYYSLGILFRITDLKLTQGYLTERVSSLAAYTHFFDESQSVAMKGGNKKKKQREVVFDDGTKSDKKIDKPNLTELTIDNYKQIITGQLKYSDLSVYENMFKRKYDNIRAKVKQDIIEEFTKNLQTGNVKLEQLTANALGLKSLKYKLDDNGKLQLSFGLRAYSLERYIESELLDTKIKILAKEKNERGHILTIYNAIIDEATSRRITKEEEVASVQRNISNYASLMTGGNKGVDFADLLKNTKLKKTGS